MFIQQLVSQRYHYQPTSSLIKWLHAPGHNDEHHGHLYLSSVQLITYIHFKRLHTQR